MKCTRSERYIALAVGGDLPRRKSRRLERHLAACDACREFVAEMSAAREFWTAPTAVEDADLAAVHSAVMQMVAQASACDRRRWRWALIPAAAAVVVLIVVLLRPTTPPPNVVRIAPPPAPAPVVVEPPRPKAPLPYGRGPERRRRAVPAMRALPPQPGSNEVLVKFKTSDPNVVVYWAYDTTGETE